MAKDRENKPDFQPDRPRRADDLFGPPAIKRPPGCRQVNWTDAQAAAWAAGFLWASEHPAALYALIQGAHAGYREATGEVTK